MCHCAHVSIRSYQIIHKVLNHSSPRRLQVTHHNRLKISSSPAVQSMQTHCAHNMRVQPTKSTDIQGPLITRETIIQGHEAINLTSKGPEAHKHTGLEVLMTNKIAKPSSAHQCFSVHTKPKPSRCSSSTTDRILTVQATKPAIKN